MKQKLKSALCGVGIAALFGGILFAGSGLWNESYGVTDTDEVSVIFYT